MIQFSCRFAFLSTFRSSNRTPKITRILTLYQENVATLTPFSKEDKILIKSLPECKGYNAWQFITEFLKKGWTMNSINRLLVKSTGIRAAADAVRILIKTSTQLSRCCWVRKTNLRAIEQPEKFHVRGGIIDHQFRRLFRKDCVSSATIKGAFSSWLKRTACKRYFRYAV